MNAWLRHWSSNVWPSLSNLTIYMGFFVGIPLLGRYDLRDEDIKATL